MAAKKSFLLRIPPALFEELSRWAADELRSVNGHVEYLLREAVREHRHRDPGTELGRRPPTGNRQPKGRRPEEEKGTGS